MPHELLVYLMSRSKTNMLSAVQTIRTTELVCLNVYSKLTLKLLQ